MTKVTKSDKKEKKDAPARSLIAAGGAVFEAAENFPRRKKGKTQAQGDADGLVMNDGKIRMAEKAKKPALIKAGKHASEIELQSKKRRADTDLMADEKKRRKALSSEADQLAKAEKTVLGKKQLKCHQLKTRELEEGSLLVGAVREIHPAELVVSLPYGLLGTVRKEHCVDSPDLVDQRGVDKESLEWGNVKLASLYSVGQFVCCCVIGNSGLDQGKEKKFSKISLSLRPSLVNAGLQKDKVKPGMFVPVSVYSIEEEHSVSCSFGTTAQGLKEGIISKKLVEKLLQTQTAPRKHDNGREPAQRAATLGQILQLEVQSVHPDSGVVRLRPASGGEKLAKYRLAGENS